MARTNRKCPVCRSHDPEFIYRNRLIIPTRGALLDGYDIVECGNCGMIYADEIPSPESIASYYADQSKKAARYEADDYVDPQYTKDMHRATYSWITEWADRDCEYRVLDAGCFTGDLLGYFKRAGCRTVCGYDPSLLGKQVALKNHNIHIETASRFQDTRFYRDGLKFGLIILSHVLEHINDTEAFIADIALSMDDRSELYIEVPDLDNWFISQDERYYVDQREPMLQFNAEHINFFTVNTLERMMNRLGFQVVAMESRTHSLAVISSVWRKWRKDTNSKAKATRYIVDSMEMYKQHNARLAAVASSPVYVWGAGGHTQRMLVFSNLAHMTIDAFIDSNLDYQGARLLDRPIIAPSEMRNGATPIVISSLMYQDQIEQQILAMGLVNPIIKLY